MIDESKIVEVAVVTEDGGQVPIGIMNAKQALSLPEELDVSLSHPDGDDASTDGLIDRQGLRTLTEPWIEPLGIQFPSPISEDAVDRVNEAKAVARRILSEIVASAVEAGWPAQEITDAIFEAAQSVDRVTTGDRLGTTPHISEAVDGQIGHEEQFD